MLTATKVADKGSGEVYRLADENGILCDMELVKPTEPGDWELYCERHPSSRHVELGWRRRTVEP